MTHYYITTRWPWHISYYWITLTHLLPCTSRMVVSCPVPAMLTATQRYSPASPVVTLFTTSEGEDIVTPPYFSGVPDTSIRANWPPTALCQYTSDTVRLEYTSQTRVTVLPLVLGYLSWSIWTSGAPANRLMQCFTNTYI